MNKTLLARELRANIAVTGIIIAVLGLYIAVIVAMFNPRLGESLDAMMASMPELFAAFGMATQARTLLDFMVNYLYGFLLTMMPFVLILILTNKMMVRYVDRGTMAYLLATPVSRVRIAATLAGVLVTLLAALLVATFAWEAVCAEWFFPGQLDYTALARVNAGVFALWLFMGGLCFLSACALPGAGPALWTGGGLCVLFFLMQMASQVGDGLGFLDAINPFAAFDPFGLAAADTGAIGGAAMLAAVGIALFAAAIAVFTRRDLSV